jgi:hypothetical protein
MRTLTVLLLFGIGCASGHAGAAPPIDSRADDKEGADVAAEATEAGAADAGPVACGEPVTLYDSMSGTASNCTFTLPTNSHAYSAIALYFNGSLISAADPDYWILSPDGSQITLTGRYCASVLEGSPSLVQVVFSCALPPP